MSFYTYALVDQTGSVAAANNYLTLFNPVGSPVTAILESITFSEYSFNNVATLSTKRISRVTAASAGVLVVASTVAKMDSTYPVQQLVLRTGNPTVILGPNLFGIPPTNKGNNVNTPVQFWWNRDKVHGLVLYPGEGIVLYQTVASVVGEILNLTLEWEEH